ncbi:MAG: TIGR03790 family protein [Burkholderiaceae bacterium]
MWRDRLWGLERGRLFCEDAKRRSIGALGGCVVGLVALAITSAAEEPFPKIELPNESLTAASVALIVNDRDPQSVETARYYALRRGIAAENVLHVAFRADADELDPAEFEPVKRQLDQRLPPGIRALALAWTRPYRVGCMSVTTAFAAGFDRSYCAKGCGKTQRSRYFDGEHTTLEGAPLRPAMLLAGKTLAEVRDLIDRGVRSDETWPLGTAYLLDTPDNTRNVRARNFARVQALLAADYSVAIIHGSELENRDDVMFYFTGMERVQGLASLRFRDGAIADHLTSLGGMLTDSPQMSSLDWLEAGATGSYGTVTEPCNYPGKFPVPGLVMAHYLSGDTLIEAYWKSVEMPGQGVFIGEPLARPFGGTHLSWSGPDLVLATRSLPPGDYLIEEASWPGDQFQDRARVRVVRFGPSEIRIANARPSHVYRILPAAL